MLAGLTGDSPPPQSSAAKASSTGTTSTTSGSTSASSATSVSAELRFASVNWERKKRAPNTNPRRSVDMPLTAEDRFLAVPWDPSEAPPRASASAPAPEISEDDEKAASEREAKLTVSAFFNKANW